MDMETIPLIERLESIPSETCMKWSVMYARKGAHREQIYALIDRLRHSDCDVRISTVRQIADVIGYIPVALFRTEMSSGQETYALENLGNEGFVYGCYVPNYDGRIVAERRAEKGLTQEQVADMAETYGTSISLWERGISPPLMKTAASVFKSLDLVPQYLVPPKKLVPYDLDGLFNCILGDLQESIDNKQPAVRRDVLEGYLSKIENLTGRMRAG